MTNKQELALEIMTMFRSSQMDANARFRKVDDKGMLTYDKTIKPEQMDEYAVDLALKRGIAKLVSQYEQEVFEIKPERVYKPLTDILLVKKDSCDIGQLERLGVPFVEYTQGNKPEWLNIENKEQNT